jgi:AraC family transcriptional regulator of adaptative response/methylated-DNA-[protein]-cysteine methyltransferase
MRTSSNNFPEYLQILFDKDVRCNKKLYATQVDTPLGLMLSIADNQFLYLLAFIDQNSLEKKIKKLKTKLNVNIVPGETVITKKITAELTAYFSGKAIIFKTPVFLLGSDFQKKVWQTLQTIPVGATCSYLELATTTGNHKAFRAVANANGANQLAIVIPCHRVINHNGKLGGYAGGLSRKRWLLIHEQATHVHQKTLSINR